MRRRGGHGLAGHAVTLDDVQGPGAVQVPERAHGHPRVQAERAEPPRPVGGVRGEVHLEEARDRHRRVGHVLDREDLGHQPLPLRGRPGGPSLADVGEQGADHHDPALQLGEALERLRSLVVAEDVPGEVDAPLAVLHGPGRLGEEQHARADGGARVVEIEADLGAEGAQPFERRRSGSPFTPSTLHVRRGRPAPPPWLEAVLGTCQRPGKRRPGGTSGGGPPRRDCAGRCATSATPAAVCGARAVAPGGDDGREQCSCRVLLCGAAGWAEELGQQPARARATRRPRPAMAARPAGKPNGAPLPGDAAAQLVLMLPVAVTLSENEQSVTAPMSMYWLSQKRPLVGLDALDRRRRPGTTLMTSAQAWSQEGVRPAGAVQDPC